MQVLLYCNSYSQNLPFVLRENLVKASSLDATIYGLWLHRWITLIQLIYRRLSSTYFLIARFNLRYSCFYLLILNDARLNARECSNWRLYLSKTKYRNIFPNQQIQFERPYASTFSFNEARLEARRVLKSITVFVHIVKSICPN